MARLGMARDRHYYMPYGNDNGQGVVIYSRSGETAPAAVFNKVFDLWQRQQQGDQNARIPEGFVVEKGTTTPQGRVIPDNYGASVRSFLGDLTESAESLQAKNPAPVFNPRPPGSEGPPGLVDVNPQGVWDLLRSLPARAVRQVNTPGKAGAAAATTAATIGAPELLPLRAAAPWLETSLNVLARSGMTGAVGTAGYNVGEMATGGKIQTLPEMLDMAAGIAATQTPFEGVNAIVNRTLTRRAAAQFSQKVVSEFQDRFPALKDHPELLNNALTTKEGGQALKNLWGADLLEDASQVAQAQRSQLLGDIAEQMKDSLGGKVPPANLVPEGTQGMIEKHYQRAAQATRDYLTAVSKGEKVGSLYEKLSPYEDDIANTLIQGTKDVRSGKWGAAFPMTDDDLRLIVSNSFTRNREVMQRYVDAATTVNLMQKSLDTTGKVDLAVMKKLWDEQRAGTPDGMQQYIKDQLDQSPFADVQMRRPLREQTKAALQYAPDILQYGLPPVLKGPPGPPVPMLPQQLPQLLGPLESWRGTPWSLETLERGIAATHPLTGGAPPPTPPTPQGAPDKPVDKSALLTFTGENAEA